MTKLNFLPSLVLLVFLISGCNKDPVAPQNMAKTDLETELRGPTITQEATLFPFLPAGDFGGAGNVLTPGTLFPPTNGSKATLKRSADYIQFNLHTTGLPKGAYTVWWVIFNDPGDCGTPNPAGGLCGEPDLLAPTAAIVWATGKVVNVNGLGNFSSRLYVGQRKDPGTQEALIGSDLELPLENPMGAEVHLIVKYHGLASEDPATLHEQLTTLLGSCGSDDGANSFDAGPFGIQCFDPQAAIFPAP